MRWVAWGEGARVRSAAVGRNRRCGSVRLPGFRRRRPGTEPVLLAILRLPAVFSQLNAQDRNIIWS
jgi:hypothetical protein